jgi:predicted dehydrogenase
MTMLHHPAHVGLIGCGNISKTYLGNAKLFPAYEITACADINRDAARARATAFGIMEKTVDQLLADPEIDVVLNLTNPAAHLVITRQALLAGKHVYSEKPLGISFTEAEEVIKLATERQLTVACAPDTFVLGAHQLARQIIDSGGIGQAVGGSAAMLGSGMENWHPNPAFFFATGGGPALDMGPYYLTALVDLLGPVAKVAAIGSIGFANRRIGTGRLIGQPIDIAVDTTVNAVLRFRSGANLAFSASWDVFAHRRSPIEIYGTKGALCLPDPNWFGGEVLLAGLNGAWMPVTAPENGVARPNQSLSGDIRVANYRGAGLAEMVLAIKAGCKPRTDGRLALHVLEVMHAMALSSGSDRTIELTTTVDRPAPVSESEARRWFIPQA